MPGGRFPWPMGDRSGGPLLGPKGGPPVDPTITFTWDTENSQALPGGATFTRTSVAEEFRNTNTWFQVGSGVIRENSIASVGGGKGFLPEPLATNQMPTVNILDPAWTISTGMVINNIGSGAFGLTEFTIDIGTATQIHFAFDAAAVGGIGSAYWIFEGGTGQFANIQRGGGGGDYATYDLTAGAVSQEGAGIIEGNITDYGNGRYKCELDISSASPTLVFYPVDTGTPGIANPSFTGANETYSSFHVQYENTLYSTTPIITSGSPLTRQPDRLDMGVAITTEFSALLDVTLPIVIGAGNTITLLGPSTTAEDILLVDENFDVIMDDGGTPVVVGTVVPGARIKIAYGRDATGRSASLNSAPVATGDAPGAGHEGENFELGSRAGVNQSRGIHHLTTLYDVRKSDGELEGLSSMSIFNVLNFGATGDGFTDDTVAVQNALNAAKVIPGSVVYFPQGFYRIFTSLDVTYDGPAAGLQSEYYGFTMRGDERYNSVLIGETTNTPLLDLTGKTRMTILDMSFANFNDLPANPSCAILMARNLTNTFGGGHHLQRVGITGYFTETLVQMASSETNVFIDVGFNAFAPSISCLELTEQILTNVNSEYIDLSSHTFVGGNTWNAFYACEWLTSSNPAGPCINIQGSDNISLMNCYTRGQTGSSIRLIDGNNRIEFVNHRDESGGDWMCEAIAGSSVNQLTFTGRGSRGFLGADTSLMTNANIAPSFLGTASAFAFDMYDYTDGFLGFTTVGTRIRNNARGSVIAGFRPDGDLTMPTDPDKAPRDVHVSFTASDERSYRRNSTPLDRSVECRMNIETASLPATAVPATVGAQTPDLNVSSTHAFFLAGNTTINTPTNIAPNPDDSDGQFLILVFKQDAVGGRTVGFSGDYDLQGGTVDLTALSRTVFWFIGIEDSGVKWVRV